MEKEISFEEKLEEANLLLRYREFEEACKIYEELISKEFKSPELHNNYGLALFYLDKAEEALKEFEKAINLNNSFALPYANTGLVYLNQEQYEEAVKFFLKALEFDSKNPETHYNLAVAYYRMDNKTEALKYYESFINYAGDEYKKLKESVKKIITQIIESQNPQNIAKDKGEAEENPSAN
ncbi:MAG: tetratricopeptide repeat protein [Thermodesulfovibrio sp.]|nr:tetratricopeptide repeat protein [Thermodesulfovibrio sp.]